MKKEDIDVVSKLLTDIKDSISELESALKKNDVDKIAAAKSKIMNLQMQIGRKI
ncbi:MAG TPA: hypothetical protein VI544_02060 [Candidatus Nanoarchaeia archaeon]|nr:hypothetical protein [Candidatus Nanoarchaeia archaeon]